jgi:hypothetical protein
MVMDRVLAQEVQLATSGSRNLLFGESGALLPDESTRPQADLPSYQDHVLDRVPYPVATATEVRPNPWAAGPSTGTSPHATPGPSRPPSPSGMRSPNVMRPVSSGDDLASMPLFSPELEPLPTSSSSHSHHSSSNVSRFFLSRRNNSSLSTHSTTSEAPSASSTPDHSSGFFSMGSHKGKPRRSGTGKSTGPVVIVGSRRGSIDRAPVPGSSGPASPVRDTAGSNWNANATPSYELSGVWANGGVTPLDSLRDLPSYDEAWGRACAGRPEYVMEHM